MTIQKIMKYLHLKENHDNLELEVIESLRKEVIKSGISSKHILGLSALEINVFGYKELVLLGNDLTFLDASGQHYSLWSNCSLEDLIDILQEY